MAIAGDPDPAVAAQLAALEAISRERPDRVLRLRGELPGDAGSWEPFELLIFRGFSSSVSHPTAFDPDQPALPATARIAYCACAVSCPARLVTGSRLNC